VNGARRGLAVVDDLRTGDARRELVGPVHETLAPRLADRDDHVGDGARGRVNGDLVSLATAHQGGPNRGLVADPALAGSGLGGSDDREAVFTIRAADDHRRADADL